MKLTPIAVAALLTASSAMAEGTAFSQFTPLTGSAGPIAVGSAAEATPISLGNANWTQVTIADRATQNTLVPGSNSGNWDMITANETGPQAGRYLFMPFETGSAGVQRIDLWDTNYATRTVTIVAPGTQGFTSGDASRWTPWGTYLTAEESWGGGSTKGRLFEVTNPLTAGANGGNLVQRTIIPRVSHEGLAFDKHNALYFVDELNGGSIYKYVSANPHATNGDAYFANGQTFVLKVGNGGQFEGNNGSAITGAGSWAAITDPAGQPISGAVMSGSTVDGRATADLASVLGTGYNRPEDLEVQTLANGKQLIYFTTTDSDVNANTTDGRSRVYTLDVDSGEVKLFASAETRDLATGLAAGGGFRNADNLAIDADGNIYIIEDRDGGVDDDIWFAKDLNHDGDLEDEGEGLARWASNGTQGSEFTGLYFDKLKPNVAYVNIQHPSSGVDRTMMITAVPEPETYALTLSGLALLGGMARRRRAR
ncbi:MAG TPA: alkaline phosphatase PhoX [Aquabacterium sp.]|nr:alkaline phosphatase PhoX [Aquabacterium sp.]